MIDRAFHQCFYPLSIIINSTTRLEFAFRRSSEIDRPLVADYVGEKGLKGGRRIIKDRLNV